ncbi:MAG: hypothetical protein ABI439_07955 [Rhodospirillales bacterium]
MRLFASLFAAAMLFAASAWAADPLPKSFYGDFAGTGLSETRPDGKPTKVQPRDFDVKITEKGDGFTLGWKTTEYTIKPGNSKIEKEKASINFLPASRPGFYKTDLAPDVLNGEPLYWALVQGDTLLVYRMVVYGDAKFEIAAWTRTMMKDGKMKLEFNRYGNGTTPRTVKGVLSRKP